MDTPPFYLWLAYGNSIIHRWKKQVLGFVGFKPVRILPLGQVKSGGAERKGAKWVAKVQHLAQTIRQAEPAKKGLRLARFLNRRAA
jgi:NAD(P)H dehydrogenase (quinone)